jgi:hypothetical protein
MTPETERLVIAMLRRIERNTLLIESQEIDNMMTQAELALALGAVADSQKTMNDQLVKAQAELIAAIQNAGNTTPAVDAALARLQAAVDAGKAVAQALDDMNPDPAP